MHYAGAYGVECKEAMRNMLDRYSGLTGSESYWLGCALKYIWRAPFKNGEQDIDKAIECLVEFKGAVYGAEKEVD